MLENEDTAQKGGDGRATRGRNPTNQLGNRKRNVKGRSWEEGREDPDLHRPEEAVRVGLSVSII